MGLINPATLADPQDRARALEEGNILFFPRIPFDFSAPDREALLGASQTGSGVHKNIAYRPLDDRVSGLADSDAASQASVHASLKHYSEAAVRFVGDLLPLYRANWHIDYASFRPLEEAGRDLPWKKRNDLLHTDAFPTRPTNGNLILRFFTNIHPQKERVWVVTNPFSQFAPGLAADAGLSRIAARVHSPVRHVRRAARAVGLPVIDRSPYDEFMLGFHDYLKKSDAFQRDCPKYRFEFPPNTAWMVFTDIVPHSVLSGRYALEQTFIVSRDSLAERDLAPVSVLEKLSGGKLTN